MTVRELVNLLTSDGIDPDWPILQGFQELNMQQPIIHQSQLSSVKIDTDAKGNAKPSVHVYDENPGTAKRIAVRIYRELQQDLKPGPPPEPANAPVSFLEGRLDLVKERLADNKQAGLWRDDDYQRGYVDGLAVAVAIMKDRPLTFLQPPPPADQQYAEVDEEASRADAVAQEGGE